MKLQNKNEAQTEGAKRKVPKSCKKGDNRDRPMCLVEKIALKFMYDHYMRNPNVIVDPEEKNRS